MDLTKPSQTWNKYKKKLIPRLIEMVIIISAFFIIKPQNWWQGGLMLGLLIMSMGIIKKAWYFKTIKPKVEFYSFLSSFAFGSFIIFMWHSLKGWTIILGVIAMALWRMWQQKKLVKETIDAGVSLLEGKNE